MNEEVEEAFRTKERDESERLKDLVYAFDPDRYREQFTNQSRSHTTVTWDPETGQPVEVDLDTVGEEEIAEAQPQSAAEVHEVLSLLREQRILS